MPVRRPPKISHSRRAESLGPLRKACPASGATFNVQVVKGKMSEKCLMHACRALSIGLFLMFIGGGMATIGYYTNHFPQDIQANTTLPMFRLKSDNRGLHLNNLSYLGPIVMGVGGFIVVAACVITFEMRDSAAKVMPAKYKVSGSSSSSSKNGHRGSSTRLRPSMSKAQWEQQLGVFRTSPAEALAERRAQTAALLHFSMTFGSPKPASSRRLSKSDSVPNIVELDAKASPNAEVPPVAKPHRHRRRTRATTSLVHRSTRDPSTLLHPSMLQFHKAAISFDETGFIERPHRDNVVASSPQGSVKFDLTPKVMNDDPPYRPPPRMRPKRSDTARRHVLARQKQIAEDLERRRHSGEASKKPRPARQSSYDSRMQPASKEVSPEGKSKSQISVCSEPPPVLSNQSSLDQGLPPASPTSPPVAPDEDDSQLKRSNSTKSYKEKIKVEERKNNEIARLFAMQHLRRNENQNDIDVISERRNFSSFASTMEDSVVIDIPLDEPPAKSDAVLEDTSLSIGETEEPPHVIQ